MIPNNHTFIGELHTKQGLWHIHLGGLINNEQIKIVLRDIPIQIVSKGSAQDYAVLTL